MDRVSTHRDPAPPIEAPACRIAGRTVQRFPLVPLTRRQSLAWVGAIGGRPLPVDEFEPCHENARALAHLFESLRVLRLVVGELDDPGTRSELRGRGSRNGRLPGPGSAQNDGQPSPTNSSDQPANEVTTREDGHDPRTRGSLVRLTDGQSAIPFIFRASWTSSEVTPPASWVERSTTTPFQTLNHSG